MEGLKLDSAAQPLARHAHNKGDDTTAAAATATTTDLAQQQLPHGWLRVWDARHAAWYYCNAELGVTQWEPPNEAAAAGGGDAMAAAAAAAPAEDAHQYCYRGPPDGRLLGPFSPADLWRWRPHLPMDLQVWCVGPHCSGSTDQGVSQRSESSQQASCAKQQQQHAQEEKNHEEADAKRDHKLSDLEEACAQAPSQTLAEVLGDAALLAAWRAEAAAWPVPPMPGKVAPVAPPAPVWEAWQARQAASLAAAATVPALVTEHDSGGDARGNQDSSRTARPNSSSSFAEYAAAALAGLPPTDDAVVLAKTAMHYGRPLEEALAAAVAAESSGGGVVVRRGAGGCSGGSVEYARDPRTGRLTAAYAASGSGSDGGGGGDTSAARLYGDLSRWASPAALEAALATRQQKRSNGGAGPVPEGGWARHNAIREAAKKRAKFADI